MLSGRKHSSLKYVVPRLYGRRWDKARRNHLDVNPWCVFCLALGQHTRATVVDHKTPHRSDVVLFWDERNWQSLCKSHHDSTKQTIERGREVTVHGLDGYPAARVGLGGVRTLEPFVAETAAPHSNSNFPRNAG